MCRYIFHGSLVETLEKKTLLFFQLHCQIWIESGQRRHRKKQRHDCRWRCRNSPFSRCDFQQLNWRAFAVERSTRKHVKNWYPQCPDLCLNDRYTSVFSRWCCIFLPFSYHERSKQIYQPCVRSYRRHFSAPLRRGQQASFQLEMVSAEWRKIYSLPGVSKEFSKSPHNWAAFHPQQKPSQQPGGPFFHCSPKEGLRYQS